MGLFRKAALFSDLHAGLKSNSILHNEDCLQFIDWFIDIAKDNDCETCIFLGDFFHNRNNTNLVTMNYGLQILNKLGKAFKKTYLIIGNHDLFYKNSRSVNSIAWAAHIPNIQIINEWVKLDNVIFAPWLVQEEYRKIAQSAGDYLFAHAEIPNFLMNKTLVMPEVGEIRSSQFTGFNHVYSGHFHLRQTQNNITYIGNAFPHNYGDANDDDRGMMILEYDGKSTYYSWPDAPKYRMVKISDLVINPAQYLPKKGYIKLILDTPISFEESIYLKETLVSEFELREMSLVPLKKDIHADDASPNSNIMFQSVDTIVQNQILGIESEFYDQNMLLDIYKGL